MKLEYAVKASCKEGGSLWPVCALGRNAEGGVWRLRMRTRNEQSYFRQKRFYYRLVTLYEIAPLCDSEYARLGSMFAKLRIWFGT